MTHGWKFSHKPFIVIGLALIINSMSWFLNITQNIGERERGREGERDEDRETEAKKERKRKLAKICFLALSLRYVTES